MNRPLLIGGAGFIGLRVYEKLVSEKYKVGILDLPEAFVKRQVPEEVNGCISFKGSICDSGFVAHVIHEFKPDCIIHLAGSPTVRSVKLDPDSGFRSIVEGTKNILRAIEEAGSAIRLVYISSSMVYGDFMCLPVSEDHVLRPKSLYGIFKLMAEELVRGYSRLFGTDALIIRPSAVYGPNMTNPNAIIPKFVALSLAKQRLSIHGDGSNAMDFTYVDDLAEGIIRAAQQGRTGETYNLTYGEGRSIVDLVELLEDAYGPQLKEFLPTPSNMPLRGALDIQKARKDFGYSPSVPLEKGLAMTLST